MNQSKRNSTNKSDSKHFSRNIQTETDAPTVPKPDPQRCSRILVPFLAISNIGLQMPSIQPILTQTQSLFQPRFLHFLFLLVFFAFQVLLCLPATLLIHCTTARFTVIIALAILLLGNILKICIFFNSTYAVIGQCVSAVSCAFILQIPSFYSMRWFLEKERYLSSGFLLLAFFLFLSAGNIIPSKFVQAEDTDLHTSLMHLFILQGSWCLFSFIMTLAFYKESSAQPSSSADKLSRKNCFESFQKCKEQGQAPFVILGVALNLGGYLSSYLLKRQLFPLHTLAETYQDMIDYLSIVLMICSTFLCAYFLQKRRLFKETLVLCSLLNLFVTIILLLVQQHLHVWEVIMVLVIRSACMPPLLLSGTEVLIEMYIDYMSEYVVSGLVFGSSFLVALGVSLGGFFLLQEQGHDVFTYLCIEAGCTFLGLVLLLCFRQQKLERYHYDVDYQRLRGLRK